MCGHTLKDDGNRMGFRKSMGRTAARRQKSHTARTECKKERKNHNCPVSDSDML